jgi:beta-N-acetylhexosaminidase
MLKPLTRAQSEWVEATFTSLSLDEKIGHLLCPEDKGYSVDEWLAILKEVPLGSAFFGLRPVERPLACMRALQQASRVPLLIASDLENGAGCMIDGATEFPRPMAAGSAGDARLVEQMGRVTAREGRAFGVHWTFSPVVDLNVNFQNPVTNVRSLGDQAVPVARLAAAWIRGMQASGELAATAKHFPGDGIDDRDQHICTSINDLPMKRWWQTYGKVWRSAVEAGVYSIMVGHIALPAYEGLEADLASALPATLNPRLQIDLLRDELGFQGVVVSDAAPMIGIASRLRSEEEAIQNILAGSDVYLFAEPKKDFALLKRAVEQGRLSIEQVEQSVRRVLEMKARLNLYERPFGADLTKKEKADHEALALRLAQKSITLLRSNELTPKSLPEGARLLTVTVTYDNGRPDNERWLPAVDQALRQRGYQVDHLDNPSHSVLFENAGSYDRVFVNVVIYPHALFGTLRLTGHMMDIFWKAFYVDHLNVVFTSFGSPYLLYEQPHLPNLYLAYGHSAASQQAAVGVWLGEIPARGKAPVKMYPKMGRIS